MKKLNFRAIFIVMLIVVLALALVACDKEKEEDKGNGGDGGSQSTANVENVKTYFNTLWDLTSGIGGESVASNEDLAISLDLGIALGTVDIGGNSVQNLNVGLGIDAILDRSSNESSANTAFKIKIYGTGNENWGTVYYFFNDPANVYIDFAGQNIRIPFNYESKDGKYTTETFSKSFYELLNKDIELLNGKSAVEAIEFFTKDLGADWTLNTLVGGVTKLFNLDLKELLYPTDPNASLNIGQMLEQYLQITQDDLFDTAGNLDIKNVLTNEMVAQILFKNDKTKVTATSGHTEISMSLIGTVLKTMDIGALINDSTTIELDYGIADNKIDGFDISLTFGSISAKVGTKAVMPKVTISVNDLSIGKASKSGIQMAANKDSYTNEVAIDASLALDLKGISISLDALLDSKEDAAPATEDSQESTQVWGDKIKERLSAYLEKNNIKDIALDGKLEIGAYGKVDLANRTDKGQTNTTALKAWLAYGDANIVEMSFVGDTIAVKVNQEAEIGGVKVVDALISLFGDDAYGLLCQFLKKTEGEAFATQLFEDDTHLVVNPKFQGAVWTNINIAKNFNDLVNGLLDRFFGNSESQPSDKTDGATPSAEAATGTVAKIASTIKAVLPYINTEDGLTIDVTNKTIGQVVAEVGKIWDSNMGKESNFIQSIIAWDKDNMLDTAIKMISIKGAKYTTSTEFLTELFKSNAKVGLSIGAEGINLGVDVTVNKDSSVSLAIDFSASALDASSIVDLGKDVSGTSDGWYYYAFAEAQETPEAGK